MQGYSYKPSKNCRIARYALIGLSVGLEFATVVAYQAPVAQLDRVLGFEPSGRRFESVRARQLLCAHTGDISNTFASGRIVPLADARGEDRSLAYALHVARVWAANQKPGDLTHSLWSLRADARSGEARGDVSGDMVYPLRLYERLRAPGFMACTTSLAL